MGNVVFPLIRGRQYGMVAAPSIFSALSIVAVALPFTARRRAHRKPDASDYTLLIALVLSVGYSGLNMAECIVGGSGLHVTEIFALGGSMVTFQKVSLGKTLLCSSLLQKVRLTTLQYQDRPSCASSLVNYRDICENIHPLALLQSLPSHLVHMVRTLHKSGLHRLHSRDHPLCVSRLPASAVLLGHQHRGPPLQKRVPFRHPH